MRRRVEMRLHDELKTMLDSVHRTGAISNAVLMDAFIPLVEEVLEMGPTSEKVSPVKKVLTLDEAMEYTEKSRNFFTHPLHALGGQSRLEAWARDGSARNINRFWIIDREVLDRTAQDGTGRPGVSGGQSRVSADEIVNRIEAKRRRNEGRQRKGRTK